MEQKKGKTSFVHNIHIYQIASKTFDVVVKCLFSFVSVCVQNFYKNNEIYIVLHTLITV